ncbi:ABC transporter ATP-binding protein [Chitinasiproducens palmae]|uniref:NitT/TauT family transport system ATP-binding protein n=1 Tax=Chitinasiproducens palmae TaxID=1770053 RepID=A0A1H2PQ15_9BURK|nr:ABC transporter ATP-binding protein [Chitinasiproducens palmae]SDV48056.1 NitT/TauT family transport system ATP-binding protein [Chitinasiproducens palmae]
MTSALSASDIGLSYDTPGGPLEVLARVTLEVAAGELVSILGPSGSGKSSLLRVLAGLQPATRGTVTLGDATLTGPDWRVALAFQDPCLLPWLSVEKNVGFGLDFARQPRTSAAERRARVDTALHAVGLDHARHRHPDQLSGGMAQRAALARCVARRPQVLLLDEPFGALDEITREAMQALLLDLVAETRAATVLVTHDIDEALIVSDRIVLLGRQGRLAGSWTLQDQRPRDPASASFASLRADIVTVMRETMHASPSPLPLAS